MGRTRTYRDAGVDLEAGYEAVRRIGRLARSTYDGNVIAGVGGFAGLYRLAGTGPGDGPGPGKAAGRAGDVVLAAGADGVGTKMLVAERMGRLETVGIDAVAYCVNDLLCQRARPLFFLDYIGGGRIDPLEVEALVHGVTEGCRQAGCVLLGGETAEMPGVYRPGSYDLVGFAVGVQESAPPDPTRIRPGDVLLALPSSGLHASGFSLVRRVVEEAGLDLAAPAPGLEGSLGEELLRPTRIYVETVLNLWRQVELKAVANVSGGGVPENLPRVLPPGLGARLEVGSWPVPPVFDLLQAAGELSQETMRSTFNLGLGMILVVAPEAVAATEAFLAGRGEPAYRVGHVVEGEGVRWEGAP
ncbi:phosphoribosylformylglycinamidine cyclo-ligase [Limnochorda pilosa]|uniref:Phosphoribosylformylglycinamidine cyclo-ligase n=1 Tax=Limnochorda pilosa TaxID=1555112 RepID=A0A0K2SK78_LIMPI|nr:phosphoribosylformylglycinamidine cyclo-ligase [Limnochorda pilosa]BAS27422.1 phosphoribosylaminoimidazole synthetase [Limnochorda pilosa]